MAPHPSRARRIGFAPLALFFLAASASQARDPGDASDGVPAFHPRGLNAVVMAAAHEAYRRLGDPGCRELFSDFSDSAHRPLRENLEAIGQSGQSYLGWLRFVDGGLQGRCDQPDVVAFTSPGSQVVRFCGDRFTRELGRRGIGFLAAIVIHEELHSLGLGEDPPSSEEITRRVEWRCGS